MNRPNWNTDDSPTVTDEARKLVTAVVENGEDDTFSIATEEELYAEVARAWYRMDPTVPHVERPMKRYAIGPNFAYQVWDQREAEAQRIIAVCARIVTEQYWLLRGAIRTDDPEYAPREALDPAAAWWQPLGEASELGVHYWVLGNGTIQLQALAARDALPMRRDERLGDRKASAEQDERVANGGVSND